MLIDEAWHLVSRPETGAYANTLARRARHLGLNLIVMSQQLSDFDTEHGVALLGNSSQQLLLAQNPREVPFIRAALQLTDREAAELERLKTVKGRHAQMLWLNGSRGHGRVALRVGPTEYWAFTSEPTEVAIRDRALARHPDDPWAAIAELAQPHAAHHARADRVEAGLRWPPRPPLAPRPRARRAPRPRAARPAAPTAAGGDAARGLRRLPRARARARSPA